VKCNISRHSAIVAFLSHYLWDGEENRFALENARLQEKMGVGFFNIAVQKLNRSVTI
jgi:hypothetical protein